MRSAVFGDWMSAEWHTDARVATPIIVSGWEWYGLVLPFHILNSGSHEPLQGDASSDFKRNFSADMPMLLITICTSLWTPSSGSFFFLSYQATGSGPSLRSDTESGGSSGGHSGECGPNPGPLSPDMIGLFWSQTAAERGRSTAAFLNTVAAGACWVS